MKSTIGFNVIGNISANSGLGVHSRHLIHLIQDTGFEVSALDINPAGDRSGYDTSFRSITVHDPSELTHPINLFVLQPSAIFSFLAMNPAFATTALRLNAAVAMWELPVVPVRWKRGFQALDVVLAASDFVGNTFSNNLSGPLVIPAPCPLYIPQKVASDRARFNLPQDSIIFVCSFEPASDPQRKNPLGTVRAFIEACPEYSKALLVIKVNNAKLHGEIHPAIKELYDLCRGYQHVLIIDESLNYQEVLSLYASCDVYISLHRSEGLGLGLMEAMALGKPVIATAWSGNMSFMNQTNSCLVEYRLVPVESKLPVYSRDFIGAPVHWADPSIAHASAWILELTRNDTLRTEIGRCAANAMHEYQARAKEGRFLSELIAVQQHRAFLPPSKCRPAPFELWQAASRRPATTMTRMRSQLQALWRKHVEWRKHEQKTN